MRRAYQRSLLCGVSLLALSVGSGAVQARGLGQAFSPVAATQAAQQAAIQAAQQAAGAAAQAQLSMSRAAAAIAAARKVQADAAAAAQAAAASSSVPDGLKTGGLMPTGGTDSDPLAGIKGDPSKWFGAAAPVQSTNGSKVQVDIVQTQSKSILYWNSFNVGANTTVNFDQQASNWVVLNRVDNSTAPSRVLGQINAIGGVYLINGNGIIFGAGSQVNVHTLVASSLDVGPLGSDLPTRDAFFKNIGVGNPDAFSIYDDRAPTSKDTNKMAGDIVVERGASITGNTQSDQVSLGSPGAVYLFGANVHNSGSITVNGGEVAMLAARTIDFVPNGYSAFPSTVLGKDDSGNSVPFVGTEFRISQFSTSYDATGYGKSNFYMPGTGAVTHDGLIDASRGIVVMNGDAVTIDNPRDSNGNTLSDSAGNLVQGVISVDTSVDRNSFVLLRAATSVTMNGVISSQPFDDGAKGLTSAQSFTPAYIELTGQASVTVASTGLISAPSAQVALNAKAIQKTGSGDQIVPGLFDQGMLSNGSGGNQNGVNANSTAAPSVLLAPGATIDVSGLQNVELPASYNFVSFQPRGEFADMPLQRPPLVILNADGTGPVYGQTLWIDIRASGTRADGTSWVGTPLADASGVVGAVPRSIYQLMTVGGSISLNTDLVSGSSVQTAGSVMNVAGGSVKFLPGMVNTTRLLGADGRIYSMANADPNITYLGIAGQFTLDHAHWGIKEIWSTDGQMFSPGYTEGHDAGTVNVATVDPALLGTIFFGSTPGERQKSSGILPLQGALALTTPSSVQIGATASANYTTQSNYTTNLSADILSKYGLSSLSITSNDFTLSSGSTLDLAAGGNFSVTTGGAIDIAGTVSAAGGSVNLVTDRVTTSTKTFTSSLFKAPTDKSGQVIAANVFVEGTIDVSGRFVNDTGLASADIVGPAFINGGSISITTSKDSTAVAGGVLDATGSILLAAGSLLDVSSGGYISRQGNARTAATGLFSGKAGSIAFTLYSGKNWDPTQGPFQPTSNVATPAFIELDGSLRGYGFESNGNLRISGAETIRIGGSLQPGETSSIWIGGAASTLPVALLTGGGFGSYTIEALTDDWGNASSNIIVSAGTSLTFQQQNLSSLLDYTATPTGSKLGQVASPALAVLPDNQRKPVDLTLRANNILLDTGSTIITDPKASISMAAVVTGDRSQQQPTDPTWTVAAQSVKLQGTIVDHGGTIFINALATHLSSQAKVDLSGTFIDNSLFGTRKGPATSGSYIAGGSFAVEAGQYNQGSNTYLAPAGTNYLVADPGALVDVSGAAGNVQFVTGSHTTSSQWSWSDAGSVNVDVSGFAWGGSFAAAGGRYLAADGSVQADPRANGGTILIGGGNMSLRQDTTDVVNALALYNSGIAPTSLNVAADQLAPFDNVYLWAGNAIGGASLVFTDLPSTNYGITGQRVGGSSSALGWNVLSISGALDWNVTNRLHIAAGVIQAPTSSRIDANISAQYVVFSGSGQNPATGSSTLTVSAQTIDLEGAPTPSNFKAGDSRPGLDFSGFSQVNLKATDDIRLGTLKVMDGLKKNTADSAATAEQSSFSGNLVTLADVNMNAQRIYPETAVSFTIETPGNVTFAAAANSNTEIPLSAGGGITVYASNITQGGNLFAPLGVITLGSTDSSVSSIITQNVELKQNSLTSVTLADTIVPYGATTDSGNNWYYNANLNPLTAPPVKGLVLAGKNVTRDDDSTIDVRGGGDLQAMEWIQGKNGSRDTLTTTPLGQTVYALLPLSQNDPIAAYDIHFATARSANNGVTVTPGDTTPLAGQQITLDGGGGIPAGTYTLYPAHYATLPGAMRVVLYSSDNTGKNLPTGSKLPDGTVLVTGNFTQSTVSGKQSAGQAVFAVQDNSVWKLYSEYQLSTANSFFRQYATKHNLPVPPKLPMDAGRLSIFGLESIVLNGTALAQPGQDSDGNIGRGGELDISAPQLAVVGHAEYVAGDVPAGYVSVDVSQINSFESVLIGGRRSDFGTDTNAGTLITPTASNVIVDTRGETFSAPEILMVAQVGQWQEIKQWVTVGSSSVLLDLPVFVPVAGSGSVTVKSGSIIDAKGTMNPGFGRNYIVPSDGQPAVTAQTIATLLGGTLSGNEITDVDLTKLPASWFSSSGASPSTIVFNDAVLQALSYYANGGPVQPGRGALFAATTDSTLQLTGPSVTGASVPTLTIKFKDVATAPPGAAGTGPVSGSLTLPGGDTGDGGRIIIEDGAKIKTGTLTLQGTASSNVFTINTTDLHANLVNLIAPSIGIGAGSTVTGKSLVLPGTNDQFADVATLALRALKGPITVYGDFDSGAKNVVLDANALVIGLDAGTPQNATITASNTITLTNTAGPSLTDGPLALPADPNDPGSTRSLNLVASEIDLGNGAVNGIASAAFMRIAGYANVNMTATSKVLVKGPGALTLGVGDLKTDLANSIVVDKVDLTITTPGVVVAGATGANSQGFSITGYAGNVLIQRAPGSNDLAPVTGEAGGNLQISASNVTIGSTIQATGGTIALNAVAGDLELESGARILATGYKNTLVDVDTYVPGGKIALSADNRGSKYVFQTQSGGGVKIDDGSVVDVSQPFGVGYGGEIDVTALAGGMTIGGQAHLLGAGGPGLGGRFKLDQQGAADLTSLAQILLDGGITGGIDIHTRTGNLELAQGATLKANAVTLTADDTTWDVNDPGRQFGQIKIRGLIDATGYGGNTLDGTGQAGGQVGLYGANAVFLASSGVIDASTTHADERGGDVTLGIGWNAQSKIFLQQGTQINVSGGTKGGLSNGTVTFRAPLDGNNDVKIAVVSNDTSTTGTSFYSDGATKFAELPVIDATNDVADRTKVGIIGARSVAVNGFIAFDTSASSHGIDGSSLGWYGVIDTAGFYKGVDAQGNLIPATSGTWTNVSGWTFNFAQSSVFVAFSTVPTVATPIRDASGNVIASITGYIMGLNQFTATAPSDLPLDGTVYTVTFNLANGTQAPTVAARATVSTTQFGRLLIQISNPGSGYTGTPVSATITSPDGSRSWTVTPTVSNLKIVSAQFQLANGFTGYDGAALSTVLVNSGGIQQIPFVQASNFSGRMVLSSDGVTTTFVPDTTNFIPSKSSGVYSTFNPANQGTPGVAVFTGGPGTGAGFFNDTISAITQGQWSYNGQNYGFTNLFTRLAPLVSSLGSDIVHVQPGVELVNSKGDITVSSNWNLAAGTVDKGSSAPAFFNPTSDYIAFNYRLATPWGGLDAGTLALRAAGNININASISDGFFQFGNYLDPTYIAAVNAYLGANGGRGIDIFNNAALYYLNSGAAVPLAPYNPNANGVSPTSQDLSIADLFPHQLLVCTSDCTPANLKVITAPSSWSLGFTAGAELSSANPTARLSVAGAQLGVNGRTVGDITVNGHTTYSSANLSGSATNVTYNVPTMVRTGTGNITMSAALDVAMTDTVAPGVIYAAGVNTQLSSGFFEPRLLANGNGLPPDLYYGTPTAAAFPENGGDVVIDAQRDIWGNIAVGNRVPQYYQPWLLSDVAVTLAGASTMGAGVFAPSETGIASQTAWWIQYSSFQQGFLSAGGNVSVLAGHDLIDVSVSLPTTGRVSGGLSANDTPVTHLYGSGNMLVRAGGNILGGSFYEGSGHATITAGGNVGQNGADTVSRYAASALTLPDVPLLAVDTGQITMTAGGALAMAGVVNPAALHAQQASSANPLETKSPATTPLYMDTYGPDSKVRLVAQSGDLTISLAPPTLGVGGGTLHPGPSIYPASFEALALQGDLITTGIGAALKVAGVTAPTAGIALSPSEHGTFDLLAQGNVDLTFGYPSTTAPQVIGRPIISAGPSLIDAAFDPFQPNNGNDEASSRAILAHQDDVADGLDTTARIYAATGDVTATGAYGARTTGDPSQVYQHIEINRPAKIYAGRDVVDLNVIVQNIHTNDVSTIQAGRNITYTGNANGGGIQVAGPGFLVVQAGGDIGPFLTESTDNAKAAPVQEGIVSLGNSSPTPVGNFFISSTTGGGSIGIYNESLLGPITNQRRNSALTDAAGTKQGADIITMFGTKFGVNYQGVVNAFSGELGSFLTTDAVWNYLGTDAGGKALAKFLSDTKTPNQALVDPNGGSAREGFNKFIASNPALLIDLFVDLPQDIRQPLLATDLGAFLSRVGAPTFQSLTGDLRNIFVDQIFFGELKTVGVVQAAGTSSDTQRGYRIIEAMFPAEWGYTANTLGAGSNGAATPVKTGDMNLLHATVQTRLGGDISIFGPGGTLTVGSLAAESNTALKLRDIGILTLGGGAINTFTDNSVLVNASRVLTTQGGDITMWSSNGDLDAGRGSKTTLSAPALQTLYDQDDYQSIDLGGFVTGAGIATLQASSVAAESSIYLLAPRGKIDFGTAGVRSSGNAVFIAPVIANSSNNSVQGTTTGIPTISVPNVGALAAGSNQAGAAAKTAEQPTAAGASKPASIFIVEVIGYGGGDGQDDATKVNTDSGTSPGGSAVQNNDGSTDQNGKSRNGRP